MTLKRICIRFLNMIMTICLIASMLPVFSFSDGFRSSETATTKDSTCIKETAADGSITGLKYVDEKAIEKQGAIKRLTEKESLNSYVFKNKDGTESVFLFSENIKYVNDSGETVEKDISIEKSKSNGFSVKSSDYKAVFPVDIKDGLIFEYRKGSIILAPQNASSEIKVIDNTALYQDVFGKETMLKYTPQLSGIKEDIVLNHYTGCSSFSFDLEIKNLTLLQKDGSVLFINDSDEPVISFGEVYAYDSAGNLSKGNLYITKEDDPEKYSLKISVSDDFLKDPKTVYPVTIDPTINEYSDGSAIQDAPVFSGQNSQNTNYGGYIYNSIGITSMGTARTAVRLYGLEINPIYRTLDAEEIVSVKLCVRETTGNASKYVNLYRITDDVSWTESTVTYNNAGAFDSSDNKGAMLNSGSWTEFDITSFAKGWQNLSYAKTMRVIFTMSGGENSSLKQVDSSECAQESKRPYIVFTYQVKNLIDDGTYFIRNKHIDKYLQPTNGSSSADTGMELRSFSGSDAQKWIVTSNGNGYYTIKSAQSNHVLSVPSGSYSTYDVQLIQTANRGDDGQQWRIYMTSYCGFAIKPKSACGSIDGVGWSDRTMSVADGNNGDGALVTQRPYVYNNSFKDEWYLVPTFLSENVNYEIENRQTELYLRPEGGYPFINNSLELWSHSDNETQKWKFTVLGNGYCKISPYCDTTLAITVNDGSELSENGSVSLKAYSEGNYRQQWLIYKVPQGFAFKAKSSDINNLVLSVSGNNPSNGSVASQQKYVNDVNIVEEWNIIDGGSDALEDGVYYISMGSMYCTVPFESSSNHANVALRSKYSQSNDICKTASQMWRIKRLENGSYSVRPLHKLDMGLDSDSGNADIFHIGSTDLSSQIINSAEWTIRKSGEKFILENQGELDLVLTSPGTFAADVTMSTWQGLSSQLWTLTKVEESNIPHGIVFYTAEGEPIIECGRYVAPGQELEIGDTLNLSVGVIDVNNISQAVTWSIAYSNTQYLDCDPDNGTITGLKHKTAGIVVTCSRLIATETCSKSYIAFVTAVPNGTFFLQNKQNNQYARIVESDVVPVFENQTVFQHEFDASEFEKWIINLNVNTGYYTIISAASDSDVFGNLYYLQVYNDCAYNGAYVMAKSFPEDYYITNGMKWKIEMAHGDAFKIVSAIGDNSNGTSNDYVLTGESLNGTNDMNLFLNTYSNNNNYIDEWNAYEFGKDKYKLLTFDSVTECELVNIATSLTGATNKPPYMELFHSLNKERLKRLMCDCDLMAIETHGYKMGIQLSDDHDNLSMNDLDELDLSGLKLIILIACLTAQDYSEIHLTNNAPVNFAEKLVCQGAETVIGFNDTVIGIVACRFADNFVANYVRKDVHLTVAQTMDFILDDSYCIYADNIAQKVEVLGNDNARFY